MPHCFWCAMDYRAVRNCTIYCRKAEYNRLSQAMLQEPFHACRMESTHHYGIVKALVSRLFSCRILLHCTTHCETQHAARWDRTTAAETLYHLDRWSGGFANGEVPKTLAAQGTAFSLGLRPPTRGIQQSQVLGTAPSIRRSHPRMAAITGRATDPGFD